MRKIFISCRRVDAEYAAGALGRELRRHFGDEQVFRDKEDVGGGVASSQEVLREIDRDSALLVLIGKDWLNAKDAHGRRRLDNSDDPLRPEIADGLRDGAAILPILLENAEMPSEEQLPSGIGQAHHLFGVALDLFEMECAMFRESSQNHQYGHRGTCLKGSR